jgi:carbohydrate kinase (thermoresistant glucokinase family)
MILVLMGVSGSGKSTVGRLLSERLKWPFLDGDDLHPQANIEKMSRGIPLGDADRWPWLERVREVMRRHEQQHENLIVACSALKQEYRTYLSENLQVKWVYLTASLEILRERLEARHGHFMKADMLKSQWETLEEPRDAIRVSVEKDTAEIVEEIIKLSGVPARVG